MFYYYNAEMKYYEKPTPTIDPILNNNDWATIQYAAQEGIASEYWNVGDRIEIPLNGTCRARTFNNKKVYAYILGFNHNAALEGDNTIHFQIGFDALENGNHIALTDWTGSNPYGGTSGTRFCVNDTATNVDGWNGSLMRTTTIPEFISCLPSDLQSALKAVNKYTDNTGDLSNVQANVTATQDKVFLLAEYEIYGTRSYANQYEQNSQAQYDYYKNGNSKRMYNDQVTGNAVRWWERSPHSSSSAVFCRVDNSGDVGGANANYSLGFAPAFVVG